MFVLAAEETAMHLNVYLQTLQWIVYSINAVTVAVLAWGVLYGLVRFIATEGQRLVGKPCARARAELRQQVGFYLLFALELLIAADVIETMLDPSLEHLGILGGVSLIRIITGYALGKELIELTHENTHG